MTPSIEATETTAPAQTPTAGVWRPDTSLPPWTHALIDLRDAAHRDNPIPWKLESMNPTMVGTGNGWNIKVFFVPHRLHQRNRAGNDTYVRFCSPDGYLFSLVVSKDSAGYTPARTVLARTVPALSRWLRSTPSTVALDDVVPPTNHRTVACSLVALREAVQDPGRWLGTDTPAERLTRGDAERLLGWAPVFTDPQEVAMLLGSDAPVGRAVDWYAQGISAAQIADWGGICDNLTAMHGWLADGFTPAEARRWFLMSVVHGRVLMRLFRDAGWLAEDARTVCGAARRFHEEQGGAQSHRFRKEYYSRLAEESSVKAALAALPSIYQDVRAQIRRSGAAAPPPVQHEKHETQHGAQYETQHGARAGWSSVLCPGEVPVSAEQAAREAAALVLRHAQADAFVAEVATFARVFFDALPDTYRRDFDDWADAHATLTGLYVRGLTVADIQHGFVETACTQDLPAGQFWIHLSAVLHERLGHRLTETAVTARSA